MIAEIHNKISSSGSNLHDRLEDQLTGDFFGALRYIPFSRGLRKILCSRSIYPATVSELIGKILVTDEPKYRFWKKFGAKGNFVEPDLIIELPEAVICIEVKYNSGLSSNDEYDEEDEQRLFDAEQSKNQLSREANAIARERDYSSKQKILLFVAREEVCKNVYELSRAKIPSNVVFGTLSWTDILEEIFVLEKFSVGYAQLIFRYCRIIEKERIRTVS